MYSFYLLKKLLQPEAIPHMLGKLYDWTLPWKFKLHLLVRTTTREDNNGLPSVVYSYLRMYRLFHQLYATKNCLESSTDKKWR